MQLVPSVNWSELKRGIFIYPASQNPLSLLIGDK
jgi:hypothetical protein